jgi:hypothetical protein
MWAGLATSLESAFACIGARRGWVLVLPALAILAGLFARPTTTHGQAATYAVRYHGTLKIGNVLPPAGTQITVVSDLPGENATICGATAVNDNFGHYWVDVQPLADKCVQRATGQGPYPGHVFLVGSENVANLHPAGPPRLDAPSTMARTHRANLRATSLPPPCAIPKRPSGALAADADSDCPVEVTVTPAPDRGGGIAPNGLNRDEGCPPTKADGTAFTPSAALGDRDVNGDTRDDYFMGRWTYVEKATGKSVTVEKW